MTERLENRAKHYVTGENAYREASMIFILGVLLFIVTETLIKDHLWKSIWEGNYAVDESDIIIVLSIAVICLLTFLLVRWRDYRREIRIRKNMENELRIEKDFAESLIQTAQSIVLVLDNDGRIVHFNDFLKRLSGYTLEEVKGKIWFDTFLPEEYQNPIKRKFLDAIETERTKGSINPIKTKDGKRIQVQWYDEILKDSDGKMIGLLAIGQDITEQLRAEQALRESETRFRELFRNMSSGVAVYEATEGGEDFIIRDFNVAGEMIERVSKEDLIGERVTDAFPIIVDSPLMSAFRKTWKTGESQNAVFTSYRDGEFLGWRLNYIYKLPTGEIVSIFDDITEQKLAEESLRESEEKFRTLVTTAPVGIVLFEGRGNILEMNDAYAQIFGYSREEMTGRRIIDFLYDEKNRREALLIYEKLEKEGGFHPLEAEIVKKNGDIIPVEISAKRIRGDKDKPDRYIAIVSDVSERRKFESELKSSREQFRKLAMNLETVREEEKKHIAFEIHDELGYALTALKLDLKWMFRKLDLKDKLLVERSKDMSDLIDTSIKKLRSITTQLRPSVLDHFGLFAAIEWQTKEFQKRTAIRCKTKINGNDSDIEDSRKSAIFRIFQEALTNVARHAEATRVDIEVDRPNRNLIMEIQDNGKGIKKEKFDDSNEAFGILGMRERARFLGGKLNISGKPAAGTKVRLDVPVAENKK